MDINQNNEHYPIVLSCINLLIQVCNETLDDSNKNKLFKKIQTKTILSYNRNNLNNSKAVYGNNNNLNILNNTSTKNLTNISTLSNQRKAFIRGIINNPNGSPLKPNFSN